MKFEYFSVVLRVLALCVLSSALFSSLLFLLLYFFLPTETSVTIHSYGKYPPKTYPQSIAIPHTSNLNPNPNLKSQAHHEFNLLSVQQDSVEFAIDTYNFCYIFHACCPLQDSNGLLNLNPNLFAAG